ncbi:MAG: hypothetical protein GY767_03835 [Shimia sp.]|nr:hypothetical protein [Shimia sp.]
MEVRRTVVVVVFGTTGAGWITVGAAAVAAGATVRAVVFLVVVVAGRAAVGVV